MISAEKNLKRLLRNTHGDVHVAIYRIIALTALKIDLGRKPQTNHGTADGDEAILSGCEWTGKTAKALGSPRATTPENRRYQSPMSQNTVQLHPTSQVRDIRTA